MGKEFDEENIWVVLSATEIMENEEKYEVECSATCNCYYYEERDDGDARRLANLIYSTRFSAVMIVSVLSLVTASFVDKYIDECYRSAQEIFGDSKPFVCDLKEKVCDTHKLMMEKRDPYYDTDIEDRLTNIYHCSGNCVGRILTVDWAIEASKDYPCELKYPPFRSIRTHSKEHAEQVYFENEMYPYCGTLRVHTINPEAGTPDADAMIQPCKGLKEYVRCYFDEITSRTIQEIFPEVRPK